MKFIDTQLLKEAISELDSHYPKENPLTVEEKILASEQIILDYKNGKSRISEYRQELIENSIILLKGRYKDNFDKCLDEFEKKAKLINSYEDDYVYLLHMIYLSAKEYTSLLLKIEKLSQELNQLMEKFNSPDKYYNSFEEIKNAGDLITSKAKEINTSNKEAHILRITNAYYQRIGHDISVGKIKLVYNTD